MTDSRPPLHSQVKRRAIDAAKRKEAILRIVEKYLGGWPTEVALARLTQALEMPLTITSEPTKVRFDSGFKDFRKKLQAKQRMTGKQRYGR